MALLAVLLSQMSRSPELTRLMLLLLVWGHLRSRPGYTTMEFQPGSKTAHLDSAPKGKGFQLRRPRERFL